MAEAQLPDRITLDLPSRLELLAILDRVTAAICERLGFDDDATSQTVMSVIEAGTNAVQHGHKRDANKSYEVRFELHADKLEVFVHDEGKGFDLQSLNPDVTTPDHLLDMRGRGIFIMRACCDEVDFKFGPNGTICHLVKYRPASPQRAADA
ncbi:MAG TPA: ATP-binding protein [Candidatus Acidoferrales bacterium]|nr:ATP-binding protein [Candidatus Acidoferrales bacterium]